MISEYELSKLTDLEFKILCYLLKKRRATVSELQDITGYAGRQVSGLLGPLTRKFEKMNIDWYIRKKDLYILNYDALSKLLPYLQEKCEAMRHEKKVRVKDYIKKFERHIKECGEEVMESGKNLVKCWSEFYGGIEVNTLPIGKPSDCKSILLVFIGSKDDFNELLVRALKHITKICQKTTKEIYFITAKWNSGQWNIIKDLFKATNTKVYLKLLYTASTVRLT